MARGGRRPPASLGRDLALPRLDDVCVEARILGQIDHLAVSYTFV